VLPATVPSSLWLSGILYFYLEVRPSAHRCFHPLLLRDLPLEVCEGSWEQHFLEVLSCYLDIGYDAKQQPNWASVRMVNNGLAILQRLPWPTPVRLELLLRVLKLFRSRTDYLYRPQSTFCSDLRFGSSLCSTDWARQNEHSKPKIKTIAGTGWWTADANFKHRQWAYSEHL